MLIIRSDSEDRYLHLKMQIAKGNETAFRELFDLFFPLITQFVFSLIKSKDAATDITDDIFIRLWNKRTEIEKIENLKVYLYKAAKNASLNYISRSAGRNVHEPFDDISVQLKDESNPEQMMITAEMARKIIEAVNSLPPRCKIVFKLVREDGLKYKEVAEILNLSVKTVDAQMVIAVSRIREAMKSHLYLPAAGKIKK